MKKMCGTLGKSVQDPTCSMLAALTSFPESNVKAYNTFEHAIKELKRGCIQAVLVPAAYPEIRHFIMDESLIINDIFSFDIPNLVMVAQIERKHYEKVFLHPATVSLLPKIMASYENTQFVTSNSVACYLAKKHQDVCAITDRVCAMLYDIPVLQVVRNSIHMPFFIFERSQRYNENIDCIE